MAIRILVCDADAGGKTGYMLVDEGMTVGRYFSVHKGGRSLANYSCTINEQPAQAGSLLSENCRFSIGPSKFGGAAKKHSVTAQARLDVVRSLFLRAQQEAANLGDVRLTNTVTALGVLDKPTGEQADQAIGLLDGTIELEKRHGACVKSEREALAEIEGEEVDDVCSSKAREPQPTSVMRGLIRVRVWLSAASTLLHNQDRPTANTDSIPVPDKGMPGDKAPATKRE